MIAARASGAFCGGILWGHFAAVLLGFGVRLINFLRLLRGRLIGRTPDFESGYRGSSPRPGAISVLSNDKTILQAVEQRCV